MKNKIFLVSIFLLIAGRLNAQPYYFRHYQVEDGLSDNTVTCSLQDDKGFMWFGTHEGIHRFDGHSFKVFKSDVNSPNGAESNIINCIYQDPNGTIWVGSDSGVYQYNANTESFSLLKISQSAKVQDIRMDAMNNLWFISDFKLTKYHTKTGKIRIYKHPDHAPTSICSTSDGTIWVSIEWGLLKKYNPLSDSFTSYDMFRKSKPGVAKWIYKIYDAGNGCILVGTAKDGAKIFNIRTGQYKDLPIYNTDRTGIRVRDFMKNSNNEYWIATETGIFIYNMKSGKSIHLRKNYSDPYSLTDNAVYTLCKDNEGGIWAGTYFGGINYYQKQLGAFKKYFPQRRANSISGNTVRVIHPSPDGHLWIGTEDAGLNKLNPKTGLFTHFKSDGTTNHISYYNIHGLLNDNDELWVTTLHHGLDVLNTKTGKVIRRYPSIPFSSKIDFIPCLFKTRSGKILAGTMEGLYEFDRKTKKFRLMKELPARYFYINLFQDSNGVLWAGTFSNGLCYYDPKTNKSGSYQLDPANPLNSGSNRPNWVYEDHSNMFWITTRSGLYKLDRKSKKIKRYTTKNGLPSNTIFAIMEDDRRNLWFSTSKGLVCFTPATERLKIYTKINGLLSDQFNYNSAYKDSDGRMYFGSVKGLISFHPDELTDNISVRPVYITGFQVNNKEPAINNRSPLKQSILYTKNITLPYNHTSFSIDFAALSYIAPEMTGYAYRMGGLDNDWTYLKTNRKVYFTGLRPGSYTFHVKANNNGIWSRKTTSLTVKILPPFWADPWAYFLYGTVFLSVFFYTIRYYYKRLEEKHRNEKEKEIYQAKIDFFTNVAHEIRTPLTLIKGPIDIVTEKMDVVMEKADEMPAIKDNLQIMGKNTDLLLNLTNQLLDFRKIEIKGFRLSFVKTDIVEFLHNHYARFKLAAEQKKVIFTINTPQQCFAYVDVEALNKIINNLIDNAIKYARSTIYLNLFPVSESDITFTIEVKNDGYLIPYALKDKIFETFSRLKETSQQTGTGIGLSLAHSLTELHKGNLKLKYPENELNIFELTLPIHQEIEFTHGINKNDLHVSNWKSSEAENQNLMKPSILIVDDSEDILTFISVNLGESYLIIKASSGQEALDKLRQETVQLVISDVMMPEMDGFELCSNIKSNIEYSHMPVILLTAKNTLQAKIEGLELGADAYIEKPFSTKHLHAQITSLLANRNKIKEYFANSPLVHIKTMAYSRADEEFLEQLNNVITKNMANVNLDVEHLIDFMNMGRTTLYRKIKAISNLSPHELINITRLKKAAELLVESNYKIATISKMVGFNSHTNFGRNFIKQFGMSPSDYVSSKQAERESGKN